MWTQTHDTVGLSRPGPAPGLPGWVEMNLTPISQMRKLRQSKAFYRAGLALSPCADPLDIGFRLARCKPCISSRYLPVPHSRPAGCPLRMLCRGLLPALPFRYIPVPPAPSALEGTLSPEPWVWLDSSLCLQGHWSMAKPASHKNVLYHPPLANACLVFITLDGHGL